MAKRIFKGGEYLVAEVGSSEVFTPEDFTDEQKQIAETTEQFVTNDILPHAEEIEHQDFAKVVEGMRKCGELGLLMIDAPEEYGGLELDKATSMLVGEKIGPSRLLLGRLRRPHRHRHPAADLLRHQGAEGAVPGETHQRRVDFGLLPDRAGIGAATPSAPGPPRPSPRTASTTCSTAPSSSSPTAASPTSSPSLPRSTRSTSPPSWSSGPSPASPSARRRRSSASRAPPPPR